MKKILVALLILGIPVLSFADTFSMWQSSFTATADTTKSLCSDVGVGKRKGILHSVCVGTAGATGTVSIFNAYNTAVNPVAVISSTAAMITGCSLYDINMSSGIVYTSDTAGTKLTMLYQCY